MRLFGAAMAATLAAVTLAAPARMMKTPSLVSMPCRTVRFIRTICPTRLPKTDPGGCYALAFRHAGFTDVSISNRGIDYPDVRRNAPPAFVHVVLEGGDLSQAFQIPHTGGRAGVDRGGDREQRLRHRGGGRAPRPLRKLAAPTI